MSDGSNPGLGVMLGKGAEIVTPARTWKISPPDQNAKERLEKLAVKVALDEVRRLKDSLDPGTYTETFNSISQNLKAYKTWRAGWQAVVFDPANTHLFLWSLLQESQPNITESRVLSLFAEVPEEVAAALAQVMPDFFRMMLEPLRSRLQPEDMAEVETKLNELQTRLLRTPASV